MLCKDPADGCDAHLSPALQDEKEELERSIAQSQSQVTQETGSEMKLVFKIEGEYLLVNICFTNVCVSMLSFSSSFSLYFMYHQIHMTKWSFYKDLLKNMQLKEMLLFHCFFFCFPPVSVTAPSANISYVLTGPPPIQVNADNANWFLGPPKLQPFLYRPPLKIEHFTVEVYYPKSINSNISGG